MLHPGIGGIILCGGRSRRMGTPKERLPFGDELLLQRMVRIVRDAVSPVVVVSQRDQPLPPLPANVLVVHDAVENEGPLAGMLAGFECLASSCEAAFVCACDHPLLRPQLIKRLVDRLETKSAVVPTLEGVMQPLLAVYRLDTLSILKQLFATGERRAHRFAELCDATFVEADTFRECDPLLDSFRDADDPTGMAVLLELCHNNPLCR